MSLEKDWWKGVYAKDIHSYLRVKEQRRFLYRNLSPQLPLRRKCIDWLLKVCDDMGFCTPVRHLAIYLLDIFMDNHTILKEHLYMLALGCLGLAVKIEELDKLIPKNSDFNALLGNKYTLIEFVQIEIAILEFFKHDLLMPTAAHFADYYSLYAISPDDIHEGKVVNYDLFKVYVLKYVEYFLEVSVLDHTFRSYAPSLTAASAIVATRMFLLVNPPWPVQLQNITLYKYSQLKQCVDAFVKALENDMIRNRKNSLRQSASHVSNDSGISVGSTSSNSSSHASSPGSMEST